MVNPPFRLICARRSNFIDQYVNWTAFSKNRIVSAISLLLLHGPTAYLIGAELIQCLVDVLMRWTLGSQPTSVPIERDMHDIIASGIGFLDKMTSTREFDPDVSYPVYISESLVVLSLSSLFEKQSWTTRQTWMIESFRNARNNSSLGFVYEEVALCVLMEIFGGKFNPLADAFHCSGSLGSRRVTLVSLKRGPDGVMQSYPVSWNAGSSDRFGLKARFPADVLAFLNDPNGKAFLFPDTHMGPDLLCFLQDETKELILLALQGKISPTLNAQTWQSAVISLMPEFFYTVVVCIKPCNPRRTQPLF
jgi:hypothetical protein